MLKSIHNLISGVFTNPYAALTALAFLLGSGCNNNLNLLAPYKDITVVYGLLDQNDTTHYIRINKAFEGSGNAYTMAQQYDSINYPIGTLSVVLQDFDIYGDPPVSIPLKTTMGIPVSSGIFSSPNQVEYYTKAALNPNDTYKLVITNVNTGKVITGSTTLLSDLAPAVGVSNAFPLSWVNEYPTKITWTTTPNGAIYQMTLRFFYTEKNGSNSVQHNIDWVFPPENNPSSINQAGQTLYYTYSGTGFLQFLKSSLQPVGAGVTRVADSIEMRFSTGSQDFQTYSNLTQPSLGVNQSKPSFTDLNNGIGIFSSRHTQVFNKVLSSTDMDSVTTDALTSNLGFLP
jgi:hypothetical protein